MPGKYSHSVVLADYSSRGIISLPADQHTKYVSSSPQPPDRPLPQARVRGTRSAQAIPYRSPSANAQWRASTADRPHPSLSTNSTPTQTRVDMPTEEDHTAFQPMRYSQYYKQLPNSTPNVNVACSSKHRPVLPASTMSPASAISEPLTVYQRRQMRSNPSISNAYRSHSPIQDASNSKNSTLRHETTQAERTKQPVFRYSNSNTSLRNDLASNRESKSESRRHQSRPTENLHLMSDSVTPIPPVPRSSFSGPWRKSSKGQVEPPVLPLPKRHTPNADQRADKPKKVRDQMRQQRQDSSMTKEKDRELTSWLELRSGSDEIFETQNYAPESLRNPPAEPNFDGFSDQTVRSPSYFEMSRRSLIDNSSSGLNLVSSKESAKKDRKDNPMPVASPQTKSNYNTSSETTTSSTINSSYGQRSASSVSSVSMANGNINSAVTTTPSSSKKANNTAPTDHQSFKDRQPWRLPEIQEDHNFTPSIFEARTSHDELRNFGKEDNEHSIGQISSGKDVTFSNDAASELSAALPPPISRFKDEEDEFNANMAKLFGEGGDYAIAKRGSYSISKSFGKKVGFFSKFRSKSQSPSK
ncbi:hypothetical protein H2198_010168 [Neophaeococcomyces mojaviensis]|uniref:Uncharacterized protein n=1 Tax=Neophaeococcomyces mojaviensis TaxID=3383035 RepID=A0ACC2ZSQ2_9EURO|nr:hypothetical protein H2198_010168 [Knufia sp. JES_112]